MLVKLEHVTKAYGDFKLDCSLSLKEGHITGLVGQNGAGKSTTFKAILGLLTPDSGSAWVFGKDSRKLTDEDRPANKKIKEFSTGMKAKLKVLLAVSHEAALLILDEPTAGLDVVAREEILDMLRGYMEQEGRGILISSHISSDLEGLCDDIYMIQGGKIVLHEDTDVILSNYGLLKLEDRQYDTLDKDHILCVKKEGFGYSALTNERQYYQENYPSLIVERCGIDQVETMLIGGKRK